jgi:hypothetical protein
MEIMSWQFLILGSAFLHLKFTSRGRVLPSLALVVGLFCGVAEPFSSDFQDRSRLSHDQHNVLALRTPGAISAGRPAKLRSGACFRKSHSKAVVANLSAVPVCRASSVPPATLGVHLVTSDVFVGYGRSPPLSDDLNTFGNQVLTKAQTSRVPP